MIIYYKKYLLDFEKLSAYREAVYISLLNNSKEDSYYI